MLLSSADVLVGEALALADADELRARQEAERLQRIHCGPRDCVKAPGAWGSPSRQHTIDPYNLSPHNSPSSVMEHPSLFHRSPTVSPAERRSPQNAWR